MCLIFIEKSDGVHGGVIPRSGSKRFCCKTNCEAKSHKKTKLRLTANSVYIRGTRSGQARVEPCIQVDQLPDTVDLDGLLKEVKSLDVWGAYFEGVKGARKRLSPQNEGGEEDLSWDQVEATTLEDISKIKD